MSLVYGVLAHFESKIYKDFLTISSLHKLKNEQNNPKHQTRNILNYIKSPA